MSRRNYDIGYDTHGEQVAEDDNVPYIEPEYQFSHSDLLYDEDVDVSRRCNGMFMKRQLSLGWSRDGRPVVIEVYVCDECGSLMDEDTLVEAARKTYTLGENFCLMPF